MAVIACDTRREEGPGLEQSCASELSKNLQVPKETLDLRSLTATEACDVLHGASEFASRSSHRGVADCAPEPHASLARLAVAVPRYRGWHLRVDRAVVRLSNGTQGFAISERALGLSCGPP